MDQLLSALKERAKELNCLYQIEEVLKNYNQDLGDVFNQIVEIIPPGWQYTDYCQAKITYNNKDYFIDSYKETPWKLTSDIKVQEHTVGKLEISYTNNFPKQDQGPFLKEEAKLIKTISIRIADFIQHKNLQKLITGFEKVKDSQNKKKTSEWRIVVDLSRRMDQDLYLRIARKMLNYLCWNGIEEANQLLRRISAGKSVELADFNEGENQPQMLKTKLNILDLSDEIFDIADQNLLDEEILTIVQRWMQEDRASFLIKTLVNLDSSLGDIADAIRRFVHLTPGGVGLSEHTMKGVKVALIRQIVTEQLAYIQVAKNFVEITDFNELLKRTIYPAGSRGQIGGKSAGLFLAWQILKKHLDEEVLGAIKIPKTWYITADGLHHFMRHNDLEEVTEQKYKDIDQVRQEYPYIIQLFKNSSFTPEIIQGLSMALDDFGNSPIIVRSSSLLEDRFGAAFSGKYKSLFLANQGSKKQKLQALIDAIAEVYSSTFGSDPIEYRAERGLIDYREEMGIIIQEVVGTKIGHYYLTAYAGVAFSNNEFRWSPRIKREDGLIRLVPGLGTRAVDRLSDDYPILIAPGQPNLRVNVTPEEIVRYTPNKMDVIDLKTNNFKTVNVEDFFKEVGHEYPQAMQLISVLRDGRIQQPSLFDFDFETDEALVTFEGLISKTPFVKQVKFLLDILKEALDVPIDIEFACDGKNFYLLQCRAQSYSPDQAPAPIPKDIPESALLFTATKYISNGYIPDITHVVYVDPLRYSEQEDFQTLIQIGRCVGKLNKVLPKRQFILMGPGRWGSRGDIKLGVSVTYSDINNTAALIEVARQKGNYVPDLSFGTHFFQDLVEASIRYLPLYPDNHENYFNERFLLKSRNILPEILPEFQTLQDTVRVIDVPVVTDGKVLKIYMNADLDEAAGVLTQPTDSDQIPKPAKTYKPTQPSEDHWKWRQHMVEQIAESLNADEFGVKSLYVFGSTKNATAGPGSDIDLLVHFNGTESQKRRLQLWLEGWSYALDEFNYLRTGYRSGGLLDIHVITDEDIKNRNSFAAKIGAITDAAKELKNYTYNRKK